ncbi:S8 family peptidase [Halorubellus salinus]|uniref:S8 family peptidase n=1 Tax=Halorubellus salinus TaxID=755309 RepID=UPI001D07382B|nr:S8 family serine peptidase [Halorubellus salinus]
MVDRSRRDVLKFSGAALGGIAVGSTVTVAERTDRFIVDAKGKTDADDLSKRGLDVVHDLSQLGYFVVEGAEKDVERAKGKYAPDMVISLDLPTDRVDVDAGDQSATDEPFYGFQWDKQVQDIPEAHETTRGEGARVAIIDSGVNAGHPDLAHAVNEELSANFTGDGQGAANAAGGYHGTHVAGIVAANDRNEAGVVGTAPGAEVVDCRVFSATTNAAFGDILAAVAYSADIGCDVANLSLGAYPVSRKGNGKFYGKFLNSTMTYANSKGTLLTISTGNDGADLQHDGPVYALPVEGAQGCGVSATGPVGFGYGGPDLEEAFDSPSNYTNYGTNAVTVSAPGGDYDPAQPAGWYYDMVLSTISEPAYDDDGDYLGAVNSYSWIAGTSMAAPQVAGAAALVKSEAPDMNANQVESLLKRTATDGTGGKEYHGSGFVNPVGALEEL